MDNGDGTSNPQLSDPTVTNFDGFTVPLTASSAVIPCQTYHLKIAIADVVDGSFDSGVFLKGGSLNSNPRYETNQTATINVGTPNLIPEGCSDGVLELTRTEDLDTSFTIDYRILGTATNGVDYTILSGSVTFATNADKASVTIVPLSDALNEGDETVILRFPNPDICNLDSLDFTYTISELSGMTSNPDSGQVPCPGDAVTIDANFNGGYGPFIYSWDNGGDAVSEEVTPVVTTDYQFTVTDVCGTSTSNDFKVEVPLFNPLTLGMPNDTTIGCTGVNINLNPSVSGGAGSYNYSWSSGQSNLNISPQITQSDKFILTVSDACGSNVQDSTLVTLDYPALLVDIIKDTVVCPGDSVLFTAQAIGGVPPYTYVWENGSQNNSTTFASQTSKIINIAVTDSCGIIPAMDSIELNIQKPTASFIVNSSRLETDEIIYFLDNSQGSVSSFEWNLGNGNTSTLNNPSTVYTNDSTYTVELKVTDSLGCVDSTLQVIKIVPPLYLWVPNAFTPNPESDALNSIFKAQGVGIDRFEMRIFNRWGEEIFFTDDFNTGWNGNFKSGKPAPIDVYVYKIFLIGESGEEIEKMGRVTLVR